MAEVSVRYAFPDPALFDLIAIYIEVEVEGDTPAVDILPPDIASIKIIVSGNWSSGASKSALEPELHLASLSGPSSHGHWLSGHNGTGFAVGLNPLAWPGLLGGKAGHYAEKHEALETFWGASVDLLLPELRACPDFQARVDAMNRFFLERRIPIDPDIVDQVAAVRQALADPECSSVEQLAERAGMTQSRLLRLTMGYFGFTPKLLIRKERFRRMLHRADLFSYGNWRQFIESQYVDQSHLIRDFKRFLGLAPSQYMALDRPIVAAAFAEARRVLGMPSIG